MPELSFVGSIKGLMEYLSYERWEMENRASEPWTDRPDYDEDGMPSE